MAKFSCYGCGNRHPGCHGQCEKYKQEKAEYEEQKAVFMKKATVQGGLESQRNAAVRKAMRRRINKWGRDSQ